MSITLTNAYKVTNGVTVIENDTQGACMGFSVNFGLGTANCSILFLLGLVSGLSLIPGTFSPQDTLNVDLTSGAWQATTGQSGTLSGPNLASFVAQLKTLRNLFESFATANNVVPGTAVPW